VSQFSLATKELHSYAA